MSKAPRAALQEVGNDKDKREEWSAQAQVDKILRKAKERERSRKYNNKLTAR